MQLIFELVIRYDYTLFNQLNRVCNNLSMNYLLPSLGYMTFEAELEKETYLNKQLVSIESPMASQTYLNEKLHSYNDRPAHVTRAVSIWYKDGKPYREKKPYKIKRVSKKKCIWNTSVYYWNRTGNEAYMMYMPFFGAYILKFKDFIIDYLTVYTSKKLAVGIGYKLHTFDLNKKMEIQFESFEGINKTQVMKFLKEASEAPDIIKHFKVTNEYIR